MSIVPAQFYPKKPISPLERRCTHWSLQHAISHQWHASSYQSPHNAQLTTAQQWADFARTAGCPPDSTANSTYAPYILTHSPTQTSLEPSMQLKEPAQTQFSSATWGHLKSAFLAFTEQHPKTLMPVDFLILDEQSFEERIVLIFERRREWPKGEEEVAWRKYRVPFQDAWAVQCGIEGFCGLDLADEYFVEVVEREVGTSYLTEG